MIYFMTPTLFYGVFEESTVVKVDCRSASPIQIKDSHLLCPYEILSTLLSIAIKLKKFNTPPNIAL